MTGQQGRRDRVIDDMPDVELIWAQLRDAIEHAAVGGHCVRLCNRESANDIVVRAMTAFVNGSPRAWWLALKYRPTVYSYPNADGVSKLDRHVPDAGARYWLILETEEIDKPVVETDVHAAQVLLQDMAFVEYYLVDSKFEWLLLENDHNEVLIVSKG